MTEQCEECGKFVAAGKKKCPVCLTKEEQINQNTSSQNTVSPSTTSPIMVKFEMPTFIHDDVALWWKQVEARLELAKAFEEKTRFTYVAAGLPPEVVRKVSDLIFQPPAVNPYQSLRERILKEFEPTNRSKLHSLLEGLQLGDKKPSALLREMRKLAQDRVTDETLRELFYRRLPASITNIFLTTGVTDLDKAAEAADQVLENPISVQTVNSVSNTQSSQSLQSSVEPQLAHLVSQMAGQIAELTKSVSQLTTDRDYRNRSRSNSRNADRRSRSRSSTPHRPRREECYHHHKYGPKARKCQWWCKKHDEWLAAKRSAAENTKGSQ